MLQTLRSHDQFNTTIYGLNDRYRGILGGRRVVFVNADDLAALGLANNQQVDLIGHWADDDVERRANGFRIVAYDTPRGCAAAYYPETNPLVPLDSTAVGSNTPTSKSVIISLVPARRPSPAIDAAAAPIRSDGRHRRRRPAQEQARARPPVLKRARHRHAGEFARVVAAFSPACAGFPAQSTRRIACSNPVT